MSRSSPFDVKEQVKQATDIVELLSRYVQLRREGRGYKALCPWHDDSRPSLQINPERQSWKCWVCDIGGDVFSFVERIEGVDFRQALALLAERAGISLKANQSALAPGDPNDKQTLYRAMDWAVQRYHQCLLQAPEAEGARNYLQERGLTAESIAKFRLGYSPDEWQWIAPLAGPAGISPLVLQKIGLLASSPRSGRSYDRFKGRVLFPIFDPQGRAVGVGGRILPGATATDTAKYINSPETPLFTKSRLLYGLEVARDSIRRTNMALVMEGYTDCIVAQQHGFQNAVAVLGTALGADHIRLLRRFSERLRIVSVLDGDEAGRRRANEVLELFLAANADLRVLTLPDNLDPCEFLLERGSEALERLIAESNDALQHAFAVATAGVDLQRDVHAATAALERLLAILAKAPRLRFDTTMDDRLREEKFLQRLAFEFRLPEHHLRTRLTQLRQKQPAPAALPASASTPVALEPLDREMLEILLFRPEVFAELAAVIRPDSIASPGARLVFDKCQMLAAVGVPISFERLLLEFDDAWVKTMLITVDEVGREKVGSEFAIRLRDVLSEYERRQHEPRVREQTAALQQQSLSTAEQLDVLRQIEQRARTRQGLSSPTDG